MTHSPEVGAEIWTVCHQLKSKGSFTRDADCRAARVAAQDNA